MNSLDIDQLFVRELERNDQCVLKISQSEIGDVGCVVWDAAIVLSKYLECKDFDFGKQLGGKKILEIGAGTGIVGVMASSYGADALITDLPDFIPLIQLNIDNNKPLITGKATAAPLVWGTETPSTEHFDFILMADCIYYEESLGPLVSTLVSVCTECTRILCCYEQRLIGNKPEIERSFFQLIAEKFHIDEIPLERQDENYRSEDIHIMEFRLKT